MNKTSAAVIRSLLLGTSCLSVLGIAHANPTGGTITAGQGTISNPSSTKTVIDQTTGKLVINWDSFSIGAGSTVQFVQPNAKAIALNRVTGSQPTSIYGSLLANGQVWIINGNGILFGRGSQINVGGILATTSDLRDADFLNGNYNFTNGTGASVINQGTIKTAKGGSVVMSGASAWNQGLIVAEAGSVTIGGAKSFTVDFDGDGLIRYAVTQPTGKADGGHTGASNSGTIEAAGGRVVMTARAAADIQGSVVNNTGMISATSARMVNGEVVLDAGDGEVAVSGTIDASGRGAGQTGGSVTVTGGTIAVADNTRIDVSGDAGGGTVKIGGDLRGQGTTPQAQSVTVGKATISADAIRTGNGGTVVVWSKGTTDFSGIVSAKGGAKSGSGGMVETSGHLLQVGGTATINTTAPKGTTGTWLLDPDTIRIQSGGQDGVNGGTVAVGDNPDGLDTIDPSTVINALATTNVSLQASNEIDVLSDLDYTSAHSLSLLSQGTITIGADVQNAGTGAINVIAGWDGTTTDPAHFTDAGVFGRWDGANVLIVSQLFNHPVSIGSAGGTTTIAGSNVVVHAYYDPTQIGYRGAGGGDIVIRTTENLSLDGTWGYDLQVGNGAMDGSVTGNVTGNIDIQTAGMLQIDTGENNGLAWIGNRSAGLESGNVSLVAGQVSSDQEFGSADSLGAMLVADLGTTSQAGSGGDVVLGITDPQTDFINTYLNTGAIEYDSPHALTLLSTGSITLPYSIQNAGMGDLTVLAGWDPSIAPADVLTTPGAYGNPTDGQNDNGGVNGANVWVVGASDTNLYDYNPGSSENNYYVGDSGTGTAIGSRGGTTTVGAAQIYVEGLNGYAQIGYHGDGGSGDIHVIANGVPGDGGLTGVYACFDGNANICLIGGRQDESNENDNPTYAQIGDLGMGVAGSASSNIYVSATGNIAISSGGTYSSDSGGVPDPDGNIANAYGQIGNGDASRSVAQTVSGTINVQAGGQTVFVSSAAPGSQAWLGNRTGADGSQSGDVTLLAASVDADSVQWGAMLAEDLGDAKGGGGNVTVGLSGTSPTSLGGVAYDGPNAFTYLNGGDIDVYQSVLNAGTGTITLVAGWDGHTLDPAHLADTGVYGNNYGAVYIGGENAMSVGSKGGTVTVLTGYLSIDAWAAFAQLGYNGAGGGNIVVRAVDDVAITSNNGYTALLGNGSLDETFVGDVTGDIDIRVGGTTTLNSYSGTPTWIGNATGDGYSATGNVTLITGEGDGNADFGENISRDLNGGDVTIGFTSGDAFYTPDIEYNSAHSFTALSAGDLDVANSIVNDGSGAITLVAGWDGQTLDPAHLADAGVYGNNSGTTIIGGNDAYTDVYVGSQSGTTTVLTGNLDVQAIWGNAQLGYHGAGSGDITVDATGDIDILGSDPAYGQYAAMIGNGALDNSVTGAVSGNISIMAGGVLTIETSSEECDCDESKPPVVAYGEGAGNWATTFIGNAGATGGQPASGTLLLISADIDDSNDANGGFGRVIASDLQNGDVTVGATDPENVLDFSGNDFSYSSSHDLTILAAGNMTFENRIQNDGSGAITLVAGWDGHYDPQAVGAAGTFGLNDGTIVIGGGNAWSGSGIGTASGGLRIFTGNLALDAEGGYAQLGYHGAGGGNISVIATGDVILAGGQDASTYAMIGNGSLSGDVEGAATGNIDIHAGGMTLVGPGFDEESGQSLDNAWIGNAASGGASGNVTLVTFDFNDGGSIADNLAADLAIGNVTIGITDSEQAVEIRNDITYDSDHSFNLLVAGSLDVESAVQNSGGGAINLVAGWDTTTLDPAHFGDHGVFGNGGGSLTVGGERARGDSSIGTAGGALNIYTNDVNVVGAVGDAQIGYVGSGNGTIAIVADGHVSLDGGDYHALIGNTPIFGFDSGAGDVSISAATINGDASALIVGDSVSLSTYAGDIGGSDDAMEVESNALSLTTAGGSAYIDSAGFTVDLNGVSLGDGALHLSAGVVRQSAAIAAGSLDVTATDGIIDLSGAGNAVDGTASFNASGWVYFTNSGAITIGTLTAGGQAVLVADQDISGGEIDAYGLSATSTHGSVTLTDDGNSFGLLSVSAAGAATIFDQASMQVAGAAVGNTLTLTASGISQSGAITASDLSITTTSGGILLNDWDNSFATLSVTASGGGTINDGAALTVTSATAGSTLVLGSAGALTQSGAISAGGLVAVGSSVTLTNSANSFGILTVTADGDAAIVDSTGMLLNGGDVGGTFTLTAGGTIGQSAVLSTGTLDISTTSGAISLNASGNSIGTLSVTTHGSDNASFTTTGDLTVASAVVGGTLGLTAANITQTGAISANLLFATATGGSTDTDAKPADVAPSPGTITLANADNAVSGTAYFSAGGDVSFTNSLATTLATSTIGGTFTLASGGAIGQTGALTAGSLDATAASGAITLTNAGNSIGTLTLSTDGSNASVTDTTGVTLAGIDVGGGSFTLAAGGAIGQNAAITAGSVNVSTTSGAITLTDSGNSFSTLTVATEGQDDATLAVSGALSVTSADVGGTLSLTATGIGQSGAISAAGVNATATSGAIALTNGENSFGALSVSTTGSNAASVTDSTGVTLGASSVGGTFTLTAGGSVAQSGALTASAVNVTAHDGSIVLTDAGNRFATLTVATDDGWQASFADLTGVTIAGASVGGALSLSAGGSVNQSGAITAGSLSVATTSGGIQLTGLSNAVAGAVRLNTPGAAAFYNTRTTWIADSSVGGDLIVLSQGDVDVIGAIQSIAGAVTVVAGWNGTTTDSAHFGDSGVYGNNEGSITIGGAESGALLGSKSGKTTVYADNLSVLGTDGLAQLGYHGAGGGDITVAVTGGVTITAGSGNAMIGNGGSDVTGAVTGNIDLRAGGIVHFTDGETTRAWISNLSNGGGETGNLILVAEDFDSAGDRIADIATSSIVGGDVTIGLTGTQDTGLDHNVAYNSSHTLTVLTAGNFVFAGSAQNAGSGAINVVAGWDGHTLDASAFGNAGVAGNNSKGITIGGSVATGGVAVGSAGGKTSLYGASLTMAATNGYAQLGYNGHGSGGILVDVTGAVSLTGGSAAGDFVQIGNGGLSTSGNNSGDIAIEAGGDVTMTGGSGTEAYVQIGHGGAESNTSAEDGYSNTGAITLTLANLVMNAGSGSAAYAQIGQGGFKAGQNLAGGTATNSGDVTVTASGNVSLTGSGPDGYVQIGNGGSQSNLNPSASAGGTDSGVITVQAPDDSDGAVTLLAGAGPNAYAQIGNGGYAVNSGATSTVANFTVTGNISVADLSLTGGGDNGYGQIGNGDASHHSYGNISGDIVISANGTITYTNGTGTHSQANIGNFTGQGTVSGTVSGAHPPPDEGGNNVTTDPTTVGAIVTTTNNNPNTQTPPITTINTVVVTTPDEGPGATTLTVHIEPPPPGPLASLDESGNGEKPTGSDSATVVIADALDGSKKQATTSAILGGLLKQTNPTDAAHVVHPVPPADQDFSSWGNEALWQ